MNAEPATSTASQPTAAIEGRAREQSLRGLSFFLDLERQARQASDFKELAFVIVNETLQLLPYRQALLCRLQPRGGLRFEAVSGVQ